ncbi:DNA-binding transcriptional regulator, MarR family [Pseudooceanicola nitratireducens]|uniref:DNA-binding transcriptional regulator, MarR family n=2 Tax=Pseudooceanicola nitratireducens TaxID=517719 RepID=A0A1I1Q2H1_9RHOB|nr:DNA-binding transcriptional regulator, MarR family [Pseudooceanicola nitratireducens]SFD16142.1 DNA-binding transcriptional regulator, MarR family [Pseudooceanicola nitratireducens]
MGDTVKDKPVKVSLGEDYNPLYQDIARFRAIMFDSLLKPHDMTMSQGWVLVHLLRENGLRQSELAERLEVATVTTSKLIDRLEARGYVERRTDPEDRRSNRVFATDQAKAIVKIMTKTIYDVDEIANVGIEQADLETTGKVLSRMRDNLRAALANR